MKPHPSSTVQTRFLTWALCLTSLLSLNSALAGEDLLADMSHAVRTLNYRGVVVYARNGEMRSLRVVHRFEDGREQERIQSLNGEPREIVRDEDVVTCILPKDRQVMLDRRELRSGLAGIRAFSSEALGPYYQVEQTGEARLIDRRCKVVMLKPTDEYRYGYRVWIDEATSLPLRLDLLGEKGQVLEQTMFTQIEFPDEITDEEMQPALDPMNFEWIRHDAADSMPVEAESQWRVGELPPGYKLVERGMRLPADSEVPVEHLLFSDGLATVSAMIRPQRNKRVRFQGRSRMGAVNVYARQVDGQHVTVMGEVPKATVEAIAKTLRPLPSEHQEHSKAAATPP